MHGSDLVSKTRETWHMKQTRLKLGKTTDNGDGNNSERIGVLNELFRQVLACHMEKSPYLQIFIQPFDETKSATLIAGTKVFLEIIIVAISSSFRIHAQSVQVMGLLVGCINVDMSTVPGRKDL